MCIYAHCYVCRKTNYFNRHNNEYISHIYRNIENSLIGNYNLIEEVKFRVIVIAFIIYSFEKYISYSVLGHSMNSCPWNFIVFYGEKEHEKGRYNRKAFRHSYCHRANRS